MALWSAIVILLIGAVLVRTKEPEKVLNAKRKLESRRNLAETVQVKWEDSGSYSSIKFTMKAFNKSFTVVAKVSEYAPHEALVIDHSPERKHPSSPVRVAYGTVNGLQHSLAILEFDGMTGFMYLNREYYEFASTFPISDIDYKQGSLPTWFNVTKLRAKDVPNKKALDTLISTRVESRRRKRDLSTNQRITNKTMELAVIHNQYVIDFYGSYEKALRVMCGTVAMLNFLFQDISLIYPLKVELVLFTKNGSESLTGNFDTDLIKMIDVAREFQPRIKFDHMVYFRRLPTVRGDLYGVSYIGTMCGGWSVSVCRDDGITSAVGLAHEMGHSMGYGHDNTDMCPNNGNVMSEVAAEGPSSFEWSDCSSRTIADFLSSPSSACMDDLPVHAFQVDNDHLWGAEYDIWAQCRMMFGEGYEPSSSSNEGVCTSLDCTPNHDDFYMSGIGAAHGTVCGYKKWCLHGYCLPGPDLTVDGGWSSWTQFSSCSLTCNWGIQTRTRTCTQPRPSVAGKDCEGPSTEYKPCLVNLCEVTKSTEQDEECYNMDSNTVASYNEDCMAVCTSRTYGITTDQFWRNGYYCSTNLSSMCIDGVCKSVSCLDGSFKDEVTEDKCGVCNGDGSTCVLYSADKLYAYAMTHNIANLTAGSRNLKFVERNPNEFSCISLIGESGKVYVSCSDTFINIRTKDFQLYYKHDRGYELNLVQTGVFTEAVVLKYQRVKYPRGAAKWSYVGPPLPAGTHLSPTTFSWKYTKFSCNATCGRGVQRTSVQCIRNDDLTPVSYRYCDPSTQPPKELFCNEKDCPPTWYLTEWSECSKSCSGGSQSRSYVCGFISSTGVRNILTEDACLDPMPSDPLVRSCNDIHCPPYYVISDWDHECSVPCDCGIRRRTAKCMIVDKNGVTKEVDRLVCAYVPVPVLNETCSNGPSCPSWTVSYNSCSASCGAGYMIPVYTCVLGGQNVSSDLCNTCTRPLSKNISCQSSVTCGPNVISASEPSEAPPLITMYA